jgi:hypothetical protein
MFPTSGKYKSYIFCLKTETRGSSKYWLNFINLHGVTSQRALVPIFIADEPHVSSEFRRPVISNSSNAMCLLMMLILLHINTWL